MSRQGIDKQGIDRPANDKPAIGWIGTGVMGAFMAGHLLDAGYRLFVHNRTKAKADPLVAKGAVWCESPRRVGQMCDIVFSIVGMPNDVESVLMGENGAIQGIREGGILCDMTTSSPSLATSMAEAAKARGVTVLDAPVTGGDVGAKNATLSIFVGGEKDKYETVKPLLELMGQKIMHCGKAGMGQQAKMANQAAVAGVMFSVCESLVYALKAGLDVRQWHHLVSTGAAGSIAMQNFGPRIMDGDFKPGFFIEHFVKDLGLVLDECRRMNLVLPGVALADQLYRSMTIRGQGKKGTQALIEALSELSGFEWAPIPKN